MTGAAISKRTRSWCVSGASCRLWKEARPQCRTPRATVLRDPFAAKQRTPKPSERAAALGSVRKHLDSPHQETVSTACAGQQRNGHVTAIPISLPSLAGNFSSTTGSENSRQRSNATSGILSFLLGRFGNSENFRRVRLIELNALLHLRVSCESYLLSISFSLYFFLSNSWCSRAVSICEKHSREQLATVLPSNVDEPLEHDAIVD